MKLIAVIPARFGASRFPGKPLAMLHSHPMIEWVYKRTQLAKGIDEVLVATDDPRIQSAVESFGGKALITDDCVSGTDRVAQVALQTDGDIFVNVQGDEPLIEPEAIEGPLELVKSGQFEMASAMAEIESEEQMQDPGVVKALADKNGRAIYFSRFPVPYSREPKSERACCFRHLGLYVYTKEILLTITRLKPSPLEIGESLEQLRALEHGISIGMAKVVSHSVGVDTPKDLEAVSKIIENENLTLPINALKTPFSIKENHSGQ